MPHILWGFSILAGGSIKNSWLCLSLGDYSAWAFWVVLSLAFHSLFTCTYRSVCRRLHISGALTQSISLTLSFSAALSFLVPFAVNSSHLGLPGLLVQSPQPKDLLGRLYLRSLPCVTAWQLPLGLRKSYSSAHLVSLSQGSLSCTVLSSFCKLLSYMFCLGFFSCLR